MTRMGQTGADVLTEEKILIVAGDPSGDLHASRLITEIRQKAPRVRVLAAGGPRMSATGATMVASLEGLGVMGFAEVFSKLPRFLHLMYQLKKCLKREQPQLVIAVDFPGFNLRLCSEAKRRGSKVMYYIAPQVWAWGRGRLRLMASVIDKLVVVFPFEVNFFRAHGIETEFVGHPLLESAVVSRDREEVKQRLGMRAGVPVVALLPGSRLQEVRRLLPPMLESARRLEAAARVEVAVGAAEAIPQQEIDRTVSRLGVPARVIRGATSELLQVSDAAVIASGSATLEAAIHGTPMVIVYRVSPISWAIARRLVSIDTIGLVNIVAGKKIVPEYLQDGIDPQRISEDLRGFLFDEKKRGELSAELKRVSEALGDSGASERAAKIALGMMGANALSKS